MSAAQPIPDPQPVASSPEPTPETTPSPPAVPASWQERELDADLRQEPTLGRYKTVTDLAKAHVEARAKLSEKGLILPKAEAPPEAWNEVYTALGRPETPEKYDLGEWKPPEGVPWDAGFQTEALAKFHALGLNSQQTRDLLSWYTDKGLAGQEALADRSKQVTDQWAAEVAKKWGQATAPKLDLANRTFDTFFPDAVRQAITDAVTPDGGPLGEHPAFLEAMAAIGQHLAEHQLLGDKEPIRHAKTPDEASAEMTSLQNDPEFLKSITDPKHPQNASARARWENLIRQSLRNPEDPASRTVFTR